MFSALVSETQKCQLTKILVLTLALLRPETTMPRWLHPNELFRCQLWTNAEVKDEKIKLCEKRQRPQALERKSSKNKTVWKWNILLSIKRWANMFWKWVKCEVWTSMVVYGNSGATCFSVADIQIRQKKNWKLSTMFTWAKTKWKWGRCSLGGRTLFFTPPRQRRRTVLPCLANRSVTPRCPSQLNMNGRSSPPTQQGHNI